MATAAKRQGLDPREIKQAFQQAWERCDSQLGFKNALEDRGYFLVRGDRRGFVALDVDGNVHSIAKWTGFKAKEVKAKLGSPENLPSVDEMQTNIRSKITDQMRSFIGDIKDRQRNDLAPLRDKQSEMASAHREERQKLNDGQQQRWVEETKARSYRLNKGLRGLFDRLTGSRKAVQKRNEMEAMEAARRDQRQRDLLTREQMKERKPLQREVQKIRRKHQEERRLLASDIRQAFKTRKVSTQPARRRDRGLDLSL